MAKQEKEEQGGTKAGFGSEVLSKTRTIVISEEVKDETHAKVLNALAFLNSEDEKSPIKVFINSPGGSADSGFAIYDAFRFSAAPIITIANGLVASSAILIFLGGDDKLRASLPNSRFMLHQPSTMARGQASDIDITSKELIKIRTRYNQLVAEHCGQKQDYVEAQVRRDFWLDAEEALEFGLASRIIRSSSEL